MSEKSTGELEKILGNTHMKDTESFLTENADVIISSDRPFSDYMHTILQQKNVKQQDIFLQADIPERYGYKLLSEEKRTKQRDVILRICYAAGLTLSETQKALRLYRMPELYAKIKRDALLMIAFNERPGSIIDVNSFLKENKADIIRSCGVND